MTGKIRKLQGKVIEIEKIGEFIIDEEALTGSTSLALVRLLNPMKPKQYSLENQQKPFTGKN